MCREEKPLISQYSATAIAGQTGPSIGPRSLILLMVSLESYQQTLYVQKRSSSDWENGI
jgi:hypothetical protein